MNDTISNSNTLDTFEQPTAANELSSGVINNTPMVGTRSYFRSRMFTSTVDHNPLISAASVLLVCNEQLKELPQHSNLEQLHHDLIHEVRAFETNAQERGYSAETILIARYILCAALDETIIYSPLANSSLWQRFKLITTLQNEQSADERFFLIVDRLLNAPKTHIELMELTYTCLSLGFQGKYRYETDGHLHLAELNDKLYQHIRHVRQDASKLRVANYFADKGKHQRVVLWPVIYKTVITSLILMGLVYGSCAFVFNAISSPAQKQVKAILTKAQG